MATSQWTKGRKDEGSLGSDLHRLRGKTKRNHRGGLSVYEILQCGNPKGRKGSHKLQQGSGGNSQGSVCHGGLSRRSHPVYRQTRKRDRLGNFTDGGQSGCCHSEGWGKLDKGCGRKGKGTRHKALQGGLQHIRG